MNEIATIAASGVWAVITLMAVVITAIGTSENRVPKTRLVRSWKKRTGYGSVVPPSDCDFDESDGINPVPWRLRALRETLAYLRYPPTQEQAERYLKRHADATPEEVAYGAGSKVLPTLTAPDTTPKRPVVVGVRSDGKRLILSVIRPGSRLVSAAPSVVIHDESGATTRRQTPVALRVLRGVPHAESGVAIDVGITDMTNARAPRNVPIWGYRTDVAVEEAILEAAQCYASATGLSIEEARIAMRKSATSSDRPSVIGIRRLPLMGSLAHETTQAQIISCIGSVSPSVADTLDAKTLPAEYLLARCREVLSSSAIESSDVERILDSFNARLDRDDNEKNADTRKRGFVKYDAERLKSIRAVLKARHSSDGKPIYVGRAAKVSQGRKTLTGGVDYGTWCDGAKCEDGPTRHFHDGRYARVQVGAHETARTIWRPMPDEVRGMDLKPFQESVSVPHYATADLMETRGDSKASVEGRRMKVRRAIIERINGYGIDAGTSDAAGMKPGARCARCWEPNPNPKHLQECGPRATVAFPDAPIRGYRAGWGVMWQPFNSNAPPSPMGKSAPIDTPMKPRHNPDLAPSERAGIPCDLMHCLGRGCTLDHPKRTKAVELDYDQQHDVSDNDLLGAGVVR